MTDFKHALTHLDTGKITEITEEIDCEFMDGIVCPKRDGELSDGTYWWIWSDAGLVSERGMIFWQKRGRHFGRCLNYDLWELFLEVANINKFFW